MMYSVGDKVVHPGYGPGVIRDIKHQQMVEEAKQYYVIDMLTGGTTLMTPVANAEQIGLRLAINDASVRKLLRILSEMPNPLPTDFRQRQSEVDERIRQGDIFVIAQVIRDLTWYGQTHGLTKRDTQLLQRAEELVGAELALIRDQEVKASIEQLQSVVAEAIRAASEDT